MIKQTLYTTVQVCNWESLIGYAKQLKEVHLETERGPEPKWIYRGQTSYTRCPDTDCKMKDFSTSLERAASNFGIHLGELPEIETKLLREFKRRAHHYNPDVPRQEDILEWWALMQHYGAPTRLQDWTYSFYFAVFMAVEPPNQGRGCEVWALNAEYFGAEQVMPRDDLEKVIAKVKQRQSDPSLKYEDHPIMKQTGIIEYLLDHPMPCVYNVTPFRLNERLTVQQGLFLLPGDITRPFEENLQAAGYENASETNLIRFKIDCSGDERREILEQLHHMNMNRATLFPGLSGYAESLKTRLAFLPPTTD
jgi:hypothetical protein